MTISNTAYVLTSLAWALYGLIAGLGVGSVARIVWTEFKRK